MLAGSSLSVGAMSNIYETSRQRIQVALNNNVDQRLTTELAVGLFLLIDECFRGLVAAMTPSPTAHDDAPESPGLTDPED